MMEELKFTKRIKNKWLKALKSGKYKQGIGKLRNRDSSKHCCLGVLVEVHPALSIDNGGNCIRRGIDVAYSPFIQMLGRDTTNLLYETNDSNPETNYQHVIPLIEAIPTVD